MQLKLEPWLRALFSQKFISSTFGFHVKLNVKWQAKRSHHKFKRWTLLHCGPRYGGYSRCVLRRAVEIFADYAVVWRSWWLVSLAHLANSVYRAVVVAERYIYEMCWWWSIYYILFNLCGWTNCAGWLWYILYCIVYIQTDYIMAVSMNSLKVFLWILIFLFFWLFGLIFEARMQDIKRNCRYFP